MESIDGSNVVVEITFTLLIICQNDTALKFP